MSLLDLPVPVPIVGARRVSFAGGALGHMPHESAEVRRRKNRESGKRWRERKGREARGADR